MLKTFTTPKYIIKPFDDTNLTFNDNLFNPDNIDIENNTVIDNLEKIRYSLLSLKEDNRYTGEIQQAVIGIEQAMLNIDHYNRRRFKQFGTSLLPVPENPTDYFQTIYDPKFNKLEINFYLKDFKELSEPTLIESMEINQKNVSAITLPVLYGYILSVYGKEGMFFIEDIDKDYIKIGVILDDIALRDISNQSQSILEFNKLNQFIKLLEHLDSEYYRENNLLNDYKSIQIVDLARINDNILNSYNDKELEKEIIIKVDLPESLDKSMEPMYYVHSYQDVRTKLSEEMGLYLFGHPNYPAVLFTFSNVTNGFSQFYVNQRFQEFNEKTIDNVVHTQKEYKNAVTQTINEVLQANLERNFVR